MRVLPLVVGAALVAGSAAAEPSLLVRHAAARVTVIPEARSDVSVTVLKTNPKMPLRIRNEGDQVVVEGPIRAGFFGLSSINCHGRTGEHYVTGTGIGRINWDELPQLVVRVPRHASISAGAAVWGIVGRGDGVDLGDSGCGDWTVADQNGPVKFSVSGSGDVHAGSTGAARVSIAGSGDVTLVHATGGLDAHISGSGDVTAARVDGPFASHVAGSGDVKVRDGQVDDMRVQVAGSGDVRFGGIARTLTANIAGSGDVSVSKVTGEVTKHVAGSGDVIVGR